MAQKEQAVWIISEVDDIMLPQYAEKLAKGDYLGIVHCWRGKMQVTINQIDYVLTDNNLLICFPQTIIGNYMRSPDCQCEILCMKQTYLKYLLEKTFHSESDWIRKYNHILDQPILELSSKQQELLRAYRNLVQCYITDEQSTFRQQMLLKLAEIIYYELSKVNQDRLGVQAGEQVAQADKIVRQFMLLLEQNYTSRHEVTWYAEQLCITPKYLTAVCTEKTGLSALKWIHKELTDNIRHLLTETDLPIKDISYRMGFTTQSAFGKYVRKTLGESPIYFREHHAFKLS